MFISSAGRGFPFLLSFRDRRVKNVGLIQLDFETMETYPPKESSSASLGFMHGLNPFSFFSPSLAVGRTTVVGRTRVPVPFKGPGPYVRGLGNTYR